MLYVFFPSLQQIYLIICFPLPHPCQDDCLQFLLLPEVGWQGAAMTSSPFLGREVKRRSDKSYLHCLVYEHRVGGVAVVLQCHAVQGQGLGSLLGAGGGAGDAVCRSLHTSDLRPIFLGETDKISTWRSKQGILSLLCFLSFVLLFVQFEHNKHHSKLPKSKQGFHSNACLTKHARIKTGNFGTP